MATYLIIENNLIVNAIEAEQDFIDAHYPDAVLLKEGEVAGVNYSVVDGKYVAPTYEVTEDFIDAEVVEPTKALE